MKDDRNKKNGDSNGNGDPTKNSWWSRCRRGMSNVTQFAQDYSTKYLLQVRQLQQLSRVAGWAFVGAGALGLPYATHASVVCFAVSQALKLVGDKTKDIQEFTDDLQAVDYEAETDNRLDSNEDRIRELETVVEEQRQIIESQMESGQALMESNSHIESALQTNSQEMAKLQASHDQLKNALQLMLEAEQSEEDDVRAENRKRYARELSAALDQGLIEPRDFDPDKDNLVRFEDNDQLTLDNEEIEEIEDNPTMR